MRRSSPPSRARRFVDSNIFLYVLMADLRYGPRTREHLGEAGLIRSRAGVSRNRTMRR